MPRRLRREPRVPGARRRRVRGACRTGASRGRTRRARRIGHRIRRRIRICGCRGNCVNLRMRGRRAGGRLPGVRGRPILGGRGRPILAVRGRPTRGVEPIGRGATRAWGTTRFRDATRTGAATRGRDTVRGRCATMPGGPVTRRPVTGLPAIHRPPPATTCTARPPSPGRSNRRRGRPGLPGGVGTGRRPERTKDLLLRHRRHHRHRRLPLPHRQGGRRGAHDPRRGAEAALVIRGLA